MAVAAFGPACSSSSPPRRADGGTSAPVAIPVSTAAPGEDAVADAHALWAKIRVNAEKAVALSADDPSRGWIDRALDSDGRALFLLLSRSEFEPYAAIRGEIRARLLFVIKPPTPDERRAAIQFVDRGMTEILKQRGQAAPPPPATPAPS
jgi:hypothetical protein